MKCGICKKILNSKAALKRHKILVHDKKKKFLCDFCPRFFGEKSNLMRHILKSHTKEMNISHIKAEHGEETVLIQNASEKVENSFECESCGKILTTKWGELKSSETA
jgi:uncharacterized Zn-finger protein